MMDAWALLWIYWIVFIFCSTFLWWWVVRFFYCPTCDWINKRRAPLYVRQVNSPWSFSTIPSDPELQQSWKVKICRDNFIITSHITAISYSCDCFVFCVLYKYSWGLSASKTKLCMSPVTYYNLDKCRNYIIRQQINFDEFYAVIVAEFRHRLTPKLKVLGA